MRRHGIRLHQRTACAKVFLLVLSCGVLLPATLDAQSPTCDECRLDLVRVATIPSDLPGNTVTPVPQIVYSRGAFLLTPTYDDAVAVWKDGEVARLGRRGRGPNEFPGNSIVTTAASRDDGVVYLAHRNRLSIVEPGGTAIRRQARLPWYPTWMVEVGGGLVAAPTRTRGLALLDVDGTVERTFRPTISLKRGDVYHVAASGDTAFWFGAIYTYRFDLLSASDGALLHTVERDPDWFPESGPAPGEPLRVRPTPRIHGVREMPGGLLLVVAAVADAEWKPMGPPRGLPISKFPPGSQIFDSILEIIDVETGRLLVSQRSPHLVHFVTGSDYLWIQRFDASGELYFDILQPVLRR